MTIRSLALTLLSLALASNSAAQEPAKTVAMLVSIASDLAKYQTAYEYATGLAEDIAQDKEPRSPKAFEFDGVRDRIEKRRKEIEAIKLPAGPDGSKPPYYFDPAWLGGTAAQKRTAGDRLIAYNRALRRHIQALTTIQATLADLEKQSKAVDAACVVLAKAFLDLAENPVVTAFFRDMFAYSYIDIELAILPQVRRFTSAARDRVKAFSNAAKAETTNLDNHTANLRLLAPSLGVAMPADIR